MTPVACLIVFALHFLGCDNWTIFRVLESYDLSTTLAAVARYIEDEAIPRHHELRINNPHRHRRTYTRHTGTTLTIDWAQGKPEYLTINASCIAATSPRKIVNNVTPDDHQVVMVITDNQISCSFWKRMGLAYPPRAAAPRPQSIGFPPE